MAAGKETNVNKVNIIVKWSGREYNIEDVSLNETVRYLKDLIKERTGVLPNRQKLLGLKHKGKLMTIIISTTYVYVVYNNNNDVKF